MCEHQYMPVKKARSVTFGGIIGILLLIVGIATFMFNAVVGLLLIIVSLILGMTGREKTVLVCSKCGEAAI